MPTNDGFPKKLTGNVTMGRATDNKWKSIVMEGIWDGRHRIRLVCGHNFV